MIQINTNLLLADVRRFEADVRRDAKAWIGLRYKTVVTALLFQTPVWDRTLGKEDPDWSIALNNWRASINTIDARFEQTAPPADTLDRFNQASAVAARAKIGDILYFANGTPYIYDLEYGLYRKGPRVTSAGFSRQAPRGILRAAATKFRLRMESI